MVCLTGFSFLYLCCIYSGKIAGAEAELGRQGRLSNSCSGHLPKLVQWESEKDMGFWGSCYVISPLLLGWKGSFGWVFFRGKWKQQLHGLKWVCFSYYSVQWTSISEKQAWFGKITWLGCLQSCISAKPFFVFPLHFMHLKHRWGVCACFLLLRKAALWINMTGGGFLSSVSGR